MYTKKDFGYDLKEKVRIKCPIPEIGDWAYSKTLEDIEEGNLWDILVSLGTMELGPEFEYSYKRLNEIADELIADKENINLDYEKES